MRRTNTIIVGAGQAGLAMSRCLADRGRDHVVLDRSSVANRWTTRWDSLRLLTPNWQSRLPGWRYIGSDPDGFMTAYQVADYLRRYALSFEAPVIEHVDVRSVTTTAGGFTVRTDQGDWQAHNVVVATGHAAVAHTPWFAAGVDPAIHQLTSAGYRNPTLLPDGQVLVVGASASGVQIADELARAGRDVTLAVGSHNRMVRQHRGTDIMCWLEWIGHLDTPLAPQTRGATTAAPADNSLQLIGSPERRDIDLGALQRAGVRLTGRCLGIDGTRAAFATDLQPSVDESDARLRSLLERIDRFIERTEWPAEPPSSNPVPPTAFPESDAAVDLRDRHVRTIVWATGFRRDYRWLRTPGTVVDGEIVHRHGVTDTPGLYAVGLRRQRTRTSTFIDGVGADAAVVADHLVARSADRPAFARAVVP
jgi:putative flavoprotein involved in K+ transport